MDCRIKPCNDGEGGGKEPRHRIGPMIGHSRCSTHSRQQLVGSLPLPSTVMPWLDHGIHAVASPPCSATVYAERSQNVFQDQVLQ